MTEAEEPDVHVVQRETVSPAGDARSDALVSLGVEGVRYFTPAEARAMAARILAAADEVDRAQSAAEE